MSAHTLRKKEILALLANHGSLSIAELAHRFNVSEMTIRRDIHHLAESGQIIRTPGGATLNRVIIFERDFTDRLRKMCEAKDKIGRAAASLIREGESIVLDSGTTTLNIARHLRDRKDITVITFSLAVLDDLHAARVELTGGRHRRSSLDLVGQQVSDCLRKVHANKAFFGAAAISFRKGIMLNDPEAPREMLQAGTERILVIDSSKIGTEALYLYCHVEDCDQVITDDGIKSEDLRRLRKITNVIVAE
ncbi:MAG: DeoR/GlpR family DNA-binding transcription regulator [Terriglobia bacterium]